MQVGREDGVCGTARDRQVHLAREPLHVDGTVNARFLQRWVHRHGVGLVVDGQLHGLGDAAHMQEVVLRYRRDDEPIVFGAKVADGDSRARHFS